jgi:peptidoglycan-associated lipoprotein
MIFALCFVMSGMLFTVSCAKKTISSDTSLTQSEEDRLAAERARQEELARQRALEEQRLLEERQRAAALQGQGAMTERERFVNEDVHFDFDSSVLSAEAQQILLDKAQWLRRNSDASVTIEGHCDERGTNEYNLALGDRRANSVRAYLTDLGISASRMDAVSYGEERPLDPGHDEAAWARNRRAHFEIR